jgi:hypothetical protein
MASELISGNPASLGHHFVTCPQVAVQRQAGPPNAMNSVSLEIAADGRRAISGLNDPNTATLCLR